MWLCVAVCGCVWLCVVVPQTRNGAVGWLLANIPATTFAVDGGTLEWQSGGGVHLDDWVCSRSCFAGETPAGSTHLVPYSLSCTTLDTAAADATLYVFGQASGAAITSGDITASSATSTLLALRRVAPQVHSFGLPKHCPGATVTTPPMVARARVGMWHGLTLLLHAPRTLRKRRRRRMPS